jgi:uroporphyrinogen-III synthase
VLVSRAKKQAGALSSLLRDLGCRVIEIPFIEIRKPSSFKPLDTALKDIASYDWLILTSVNGVEAMFERMATKKVAASSLAHLKIAAIGPATKSAIEKRGLKVVVTPKEYIAESVVAALHRRVNAKRVLLVRAKVARDVIPRELRKAGAQVEVIEAYETVAPEASAKRLRAVLVSNRKPHAITFTSSSTVKNFVDLIGLRGARAAIKSGVHTASIGPVTSATLREFGLPVNIEAKQYTMQGLVDAIKQGSASSTPRAAGTSGARPIPGVSPMAASVLNDPTLDPIQRRVLNDMIRNGVPITSKNIYDFVFNFKTGEKYEYDAEEEALFIPPALRKPRPKFRF